MEMDRPPTMAKQIITEDELTKMAKQEFPMPKKPCRDVRARVLRLREQFILMLKRQQEKYGNNKG